MTSRKIHRERNVNQCTMLLPFLCMLFCLFQGSFYLLGLGLGEQSARRASVEQDTASTEASSACSPVKGDEERLKLLKMLSTGGNTDARQGRLWFTEGSPGMKVGCLSSPPSVPLFSK